MKTFLTMKALSVLLAGGGLVSAGAFVASSTNLSGQEKGWTVWVKTSPCSGRNDWVSVAKENPAHGGGGGSWTTADHVLTGGTLKCVRVNDICTFAAAEAEREIVRASSQFSNYCCRDYSVWKNNTTGKMEIKVGKFGQGIPGLDFERGDLCCEEAEALAGLPGACSGSHGGGTTGYIGCFKDPNSPFDLDGFLERSSSNTPQRCIATCRAKGFAYAGVQYGQSCLCGNSYGKFGPANNCNMKCTGASGQICGGFNANSVYGTGVSAGGGGGRPKQPANDDDRGGGAVSLAGRWGSNIGNVYNISQSGSTFTWLVEGKSEKGVGRLNGRSTSARWDGGSAQGRVTEVDASGRATRIEWSNGVVFTRE